MSKLAFNIADSAGTAVGGLVGERLGATIAKELDLPLAKDGVKILGTLLGGTVGSQIGASRRKQEEQSQIAQMFQGMQGMNATGLQPALPPPMAPYAIDPSTVDIPKWALSGARFLAPAMKTGSAEPNIWGLLGQEIPGYALYEGARKTLANNGSVPKAIANGAALQAGTTLPALGAGYGAYHLAHKALDHNDTRVLGMPISHWLTALAMLGAGTVGYNKVNNAIFHP